MIPLLLKLKIINCFHRGFGTFQSFDKFKKKKKVMRIINCKKVKFGAYQVVSQPSFFCWTSYKLSHLCEPTSC